MISDSMGKRKHAFEKHLKKHHSQYQCNLTQKTFKLSRVQDGKEEFRIAALAPPAKTSP